MKLVPLPGRPNYQKSVIIYQTTAVADVRDFDVRSLESILVDREWRTAVTGPDRRGRVATRCHKLLMSDTLDMGVHVRLVTMLMLAAACCRTLDNQRHRSQLRAVDHYSAKTLRYCKTFNLNFSCHKLMYCIARRFISHCKWPTCKMQGACVWLMIRLREFRWRP